MSLELVLIIILIIIILILIIILIIDLTVVLFEVWLVSLGFFTVLPCSIVIKQHCTGLSEHPEHQLQDISRCVLLVLTLAAIGVFGTQFYCRWIVSVYIRTPKFTITEQHGSTQLS